MSVGFNRLCDPSGAMTPAPHVAAARAHVGWSEYGNCRGLKVKGFSVTGALWELGLKRSLRHFFPSGSHRFCFHRFTPLSHSQSSPSILPPFILTAFHLHCLHLLKSLHLWVQFHSRVDNQEFHLFLLFSDTSASLFFFLTSSVYLLMPLWIFLLMLKKIARVPSLPLLFFCSFLLRGPNPSLPPPPAPWQCSFKQFHSHCSLLPVCRTTGSPLPPSLPPSAPSIFHGDT